MAEGRIQKALSGFYYVDTGAEVLTCRARVMRKELRNRGILHQTVVFSPEQPAPTQQLEAPPPGRRSVPASNPWVPATAGLLMGSKVVRDLIAQKEA